MVSENSPSNSNSSILHQFIISNSKANQNQFGNQHFDAYETDSLPLSIQCPGDRMSRSADLVHAPQQSEKSDISHDRSLMDLLGTSNEAVYQAQRLSLSLGSVPCGPRPLNSSLLNPGYLISGEAARDSCNTGLDLKPAQSLLEEMMNVGGKDIDASNQKYVEKLSPGSRKGSYGLSSELKTEFSNSQLLNEKNGTYINLLKLLALLEEVERRYEEYYHHMEELVSSFEGIACLGAGKSYTALALQAMSKHFCSLRNAIVSQIRATKQKMEKDMPKIRSRLSQLSLLIKKLGKIEIPLDLCIIHVKHGGQSEDYQILLSQFFVPGSLNTFCIFIPMTLKSSC